MNVITPHSTDPVCDGELMFHLVRQLEIHLAFSTRRQISQSLHFNCYSQAITLLGAVLIIGNESMAEPDENQSEVTTQRFSYTSTSLTPQQFGNSDVFLSLLKERIH